MPEEQLQSGENVGRCRSYPPSPPVGGDGKKEYYDRSF
jgi:hypothetical protein